ncbi:hypothetical protein ACIPY2_07145 [Paenarthrobacter sp. NPDC089675]|uniref:hypothetical protein n=1 Tax=Paenarthrobacter sp. NPDC089675 TaxID=3364376 RepID=UPI0038120995
MTSRLQNIKSRVKHAGKVVVYSSTGTEIARALMASPPGSPAKRLLKVRGLEGRIRRVASEKLPSGVFFAKLTISNWQELVGSPFRLFEDGEMVYGNVIEPPARGFPLEYRNIMVRSDDPARYHLDLDVPFDLKIGHGAYTTPQQLAYDEQYGVEQHGDTYYSLRGNTVNPKKLLITFPGFGPSTTRVSYAVSYLKALTDADLQETLMVCFQDRYLAAGSYMLVDNAGRPLEDRVTATIEGLRKRFGIDPAAMLFFGASKGGSIAIQYARTFPAARLLLAAPQMNLPYYFSKPFFKDNLFRNRSLRSMQQPEERLRQYFAEGRTIDYFYTDSDELSNHSLIELVQDVPNLTKYRINGKHAEVARTALPAMLGIIRQFLAGASVERFECEELRAFHGDEGVQLQVRVDPKASSVSNANWFVEGHCGRTRFLQLMTNHSYDFVKYTSAEQILFKSSDPVEHMTSVTAIAPEGTRWTAALPKRLNPGRRALKQELPTAALSLTSDVVQDYAILDGNARARFRYRAWRANAGGNTMEVHVVSDVFASVEALVHSDSTWRSGFVALVQPLDGLSLAHLMALRMVVAADVPHLAVAVDGTLDPEDTPDGLPAIEWDSLRVIDPRDGETVAVSIGPGPREPGQEP